MSLLQLFNVPATQALVRNENSRSLVTLPSFCQGDDTTIRYMALEQNVSQSSVSPWSKILPATYSLKIGIYTAGGSQLAFQDTWTPDATNCVYTGSLTQNSENVTTAIGSISVGASITAYLHVILTDSSGYKTTALPPTAVLFYKTAITSGATTIPTGETAAYQSWVRSICVLKEGSAGDRIIMKDDNGVSYLFYVDTTGVLRADPLS